MSKTSVYFGGSRSLTGHWSPLIALAVERVIASGQAVHVGCQFGADQAVIQCCPPSSLFVFAVAPSLAKCNAHVSHAWLCGANLTTSAGGYTASIKARYLLRSIAAFRGCSSAVFFAPGSGSLAVARECVRSGLPVFAFGTQPARVPSISGQWVASSFVGFSCWQWSAPSQPALL